MKLDRQAITWTLGVLAITAGFVLVITRAQFRRFDEVKTLIKGEQTELTLGRSTPQANESVRQEVKQLAARVGNYDAMVPEQANVGLFLEELARFAHARSIVQDAIEPGAPLETDGIAALPITLRLRGSFSSVYGFIQDIEHMKRMTQVERFKTTVSDEKPGEVSADLKLHVFYRAS